MKHFPALIFAVVSFALTTTSPAFLDIFKKDLDKVPETEQMRAQEAAAKVKLTEALEYETAGKQDKAFDIYKGVVKKYPLTTSAAMSQYKVGSIQKDKGQYVKAFASFQEFVENYKQSSAFDAAVASQYEIAKASQTGEHRESVIGISRKVQRSEVLSMYQSIIKNAPYSEYAPQAQFAIGEVLEQDGKGPQAVSAYKKVVASYPKTKLAKDAQYRIGEIGSKAIEAGSRNIANVDSSRRAYEDLILMDKEDSARREEARSKVAQFNELEAQKAYEVGRYYEKQKKYKSAALYYRRVVARAAGTSAADQASERLSIVEAKIPDSQAPVAVEETASNSRSFRPGAAAGAAATKVKESRPRLGGRIFGRKKRAAAREAEEAEAARLAVAAREPGTAGSKPPRPVVQKKVTPGSKPPVASPKPTASGAQIAKVAPGGTKLTKRKGYHGPPAPNLALGKKKNKMRIDTSKLQDAPFDIGKIDAKDLDKGLKKIREELPDDVKEKIPDDLSNLVIPPDVEEKIDDAKKELANKAEEEAEEETKKAAEKKNEGGLKVPPLPDDE